MKKILTILLVGVGTLAIAQKKSYLSRSIDDNGKTLSIRVTGTIDGKDINFERSFDVEAMSKEERTALRDKVLESIGTGNLPEPPLPPAAPKPVAPSAPMEPRAGTGAFYAGNDRDTHLVSTAKGYGNVENPGVKGFTKQIKISQEAAEMFLRYSFTKENEEFIFEKTVNILEKSESQRQRIIEDFENEIGLPGKGIEM